MGGTFAAVGLDVRRGSGKTRKRGENLRGGNVGMVTVVVAIRVCKGNLEYRQKNQRVKAIREWRGPGDEKGDWTARFTKDEGEKRKDQT